MMCDTNAVYVQQNFVSTNRYAPLLSLPENHDSHEVVVKQGNEDCESLENMKSTMVTSPQHKTGRKIPTIVNGQVLDNDNNKVQGTTWLTNIQIRAMHEIVDRLFRKYSQIDLNHIEPYNHKFRNSIAVPRLEIAFAGRPKG